MNRVRPPISSALLFFALAMLSLRVEATSPAGLAFSHNDWELACDNTRTCRAAGYQSDEEEMAVSVLLTRKAGPRQSVIGELMLGSPDDDNTLSKFPALLKLSMRVNGKSVGQVRIRKDSLVAQLSADQVAALLAALPRKSRIEWQTGRLRWQLSDLGAAAVLLKMDEFQGRIGTQGALIKKGTRSEDSVLAPLPAPIVEAAVLAKPRPSDDQMTTGQVKALRHALLAVLKDDDCSVSLEGENELSIDRLSNTKLLVSMPCWRGAYNMGDGYWVINDKPPYHPVLVTTSGSEYGEGSITSSHKDRGIGDCWSSEAWVWNGNEFAQAAKSSTGMCKLLAPGGAWHLPTFVTDVRRSSRDPM